MTDENPQKLETMDPESCSSTKTVDTDGPKDVGDVGVEVVHPDSSNGATEPMSAEDVVGCDELRGSSEASETVSRETVQQAAVSTSKISSSQESKTIQFIKHEHAEVVSSEVTSQELTEFSEKHTTEMVSKQDFSQTLNQSVTEEQSSFTESTSSTVVETSSTFESSSSETETTAKAQGSPYYDSLIANRISSEISSQGTDVPPEAGSIPADPIQNIPEDTACHNGQDKGPQVVASTEEITAPVQGGGLELESLRRLESEVLQNGGRLATEVKMAQSSTEEVHVTNSVSEMFKVTEFQTKSFSEVMKDITSFNCAESTTMVESHTTNGFQSGENQTQSESNMGIPPTNDYRDVPISVSPNAYKPATDEMDFIELPKKKKMFSSSSFYEEPNAIYPTVEEQVELCRKIADSLSDDTNKKSKGANMFFKRVKKAEKWIHESTGMGEDDTYSYTETYSESMTDPSSGPYIRVSKGPPQLKLILDPRHLLDMKRLRQEGVNIVEHNAVSPEICLGLVKDLNSPIGRGGQLFAKRKKKSEEWIVDEEKVKALLKSREYGYTPSPEPTNEITRSSNTESFVQSRVQMIKTPWAAAMESPIGSCMGAFREVNPNDVAETVIRAAETKVMTYPAPVRPVIEPGLQSQSRVSQMQQNFQSPVGFTPYEKPTVRAPITSSFKTGVYTADPYRPRAPKGWSGMSSGSSQFSPMPTIYQAPEPVQSQYVENPSQEQIHIAPDAEAATKLTHLPAFSRAYNFANFNASPKAWGSANTMEYQNLHIKPVKPPSVLVQ